MADVNVALDGERHGEPDGGRVEDGRYILHEEVHQQTPVVGNPLVEAFSSVEIDEYRNRK